VHVSDEERIELGTFMALADGFGRLVEVLGAARVIRPVRSGSDAAGPYA
jgi:hypothetical protein